MLPWLSGCQEHDETDSCPQTWLIFDAVRINSIVQPLWMIFFYWCSKFDCRWHNTRYLSVMSFHNSAIQKSKTQLLQGILGSSFLFEMDLWMHVISAGCLFCTCVHYDWLIKFDHTEELWCYHVTNSLLLWPPTDSGMHSFLACLKQFRHRVCC